MSLWEFQACVDGWVKANGGGKTEPPTNEEHDALVERFKHLD